MKGFLFVEGNCPQAAFWITKQGSISRKYHSSFIGCVVTDPKNNPELLIKSILATNPRGIKWNADYLNNLG